MNEYTVRIPGELRGKGRPRLSTRGGFARAHTDEKTANAEAWVRACAIDDGVIRPLEGALSLVVTITKGVPPSWSKRKRADAIAQTLLPTGRPDIDNCVKLICDSLNGIAWVDDAQIVSMLVTKVYGDVPHTMMTVRAI